MTGRPLDLVFLGSGAFGLPTLRALAGRHTVRAIVTQPDRRAGRGSSLAPTPIAEWAAGHLPAVPIHKPERLNRKSNLGTIPPALINVKDNSPFEHSALVSLTNARHETLRSKENQIKTF